MLPSAARLAGVAAASLELADADPHVGGYLLYLCIEGHRLRHVSCDFLDGWAVRVFRCAHVLLRYFGLPAVM